MMFFAEINRFPTLGEDEKIAIVPFLEASKGVVKFVELLGTVFAPVRQDINGNIEKLYNIHNSDKEKFLTLHDIVEYELDKSDKVGIDALLWLKRALEYVQVFITCLVEDHKQGFNTENLGPFFHKAYDEKLKPYHGWFVQKLFGLIVYAAPSRKNLMLLLSGENQEVSEDEVIKSAESFLTELNLNIEYINKLYNLHNLKFEDKV